MNTRPKSYGDLIPGYDDMSPEQRHAENMKIPVKVGDVVDWIDDYGGLRKGYKVVKIDKKSPHLLWARGGMMGQPYTFIRVQIVPPSSKAKPEGDPAETPAMPTVQATPESVVEKLLGESTYAEGQRVILKGYPKGSEDFPDGLPEERGVIEGDEGEGMYVVRVDDKYLEDGDDGLREVHADQISAETATEPKPQMYHVMYPEGKMLMVYHPRNGGTVSKMNRQMYAKLVAQGKAKPYVEKTK